MATGARASVVAIVGVVFTVIGGTIFWTSYYHKKIGKISIYLPISIVIN
jgi:hypothetical protein